jgi:hypothetical protein
MWWSGDNDGWSAHNPLLYAHYPFACEDYERLVKVEEQESGFD